MTICNFGNYLRDHQSDSWRAASLFVASKETDASNALWNQFESLETIALQA
jgi:hypothetical protein